MIDSREKFKSNVQTPLWKYVYNTEDIDIIEFKTI